VCFCSLTYQNAKRIRLIVLSCSVSACIKFSTLFHKQHVFRRKVTEFKMCVGAWMSVCCERCVLLGWGLCEEMITRQEDSYRLCCVVECDLDTSWMRRPWPTGGLSPQIENEAISVLDDRLFVWPPSRCVAVLLLAVNKNPAFRIHHNKQCPLGNTVWNSITCVTFHHSSSINLIFPKVNFKILYQHFSNFA
jgi:hypothetical protein